MTPWLAVLAPVAAVVTAQPTRTIRAISVNGQEVSPGSLVLCEPDGSYALLLDDTRAWALRLPARADQNYGGREFVPLRTIPEIAVSYDEAFQRLELRVPGSLLERTEIDEAEQEDQPAPTRDRGAFLNYDVHQENVAGIGTATTVFNSGMTLGSGVVNANFIGAFGNAVQQQTGLRRISSNWQHDDVRRHTTLLLGDAMYQTDALVPGNAFFGVQYATNFATAPGMVIEPRPSIAGTSEAASRADVYVDGKLVVQEDVPAGPFTLQNIPLAGGSGKVQVVVTDVQGRRQVLVTPYATAPGLLKRGLGEFSWGGGVMSVSSQFGVPQYGGALAQMFERRGFSDRFTGELDAQLAPGASSFSGGGLLAVPHFGTLDAALSVGQQGGGRFDYEYSSRGVDFGFGVSSLPQTSQIVALGSDIQSPTGISHSSTAFIGFPLFGGSSFSVSLVNEVDRQSGEADLTTRTLEASYTLPLGGTELSVDAFKSSGSLPTTAMTVNLSIPLGPRRYATAMAGKENGTSVAQVTVESDPLYQDHHTEPGYVVTAGDAELAAELDYPFKAMELDAGFSKIDGIGGYQVEALGSLAMVHGHLLASQSITQAYGLAVIPGHPHVHVYANNQYVGTTNAGGMVLLPDLQPYQSNIVTIDEKDFPVTANLESVSQTVVPYANSPVVVRFQQHGYGGVIVHVRTPDGAYLPAGASLNAEGRSWSVVDRGEAYIDGMPPGPLMLWSRVGDRSCRIHILLPQQMGKVPDLGETVCQ